MIVLPAILLSPLGRLFEPKQKHENAEVKGVDMGDSLRKASVLGLLVIVALAEVPAQAADTKQRDELAHLLPDQVISAVCVSDFSSAVATHQRQTKAEADRWVDFQTKFGVDPEELASATEGPLLRAVLLADGKEEELVLAKVAGEDLDPQIGSHVADGVYIAATNDSLAKAARTKTLVDIDTSKLPLWVGISAAEKNEAEASDSTLWWYADTWLKDRVEAENNPDDKPAKRYRNALRHGFDVIKSSAGVVQISGSQIGESAGLVRAERPWKSTLGMFEHLQPVEQFQLEPWIPGKLESVTFMSVDLPKAFGYIDAVFDDGFADGIEGTYRDLLEDIKIGINVDMMKDLFADFGRKVYFLRAKPTEPRPQAYLIALETKNPAQAAEVIEKLMQDDPEAKPVKVGEHPYPMYLAKAKKKQGGDFVMMVAYNYAFYANSESLMRQVLEPAEQNTLDQDPVVKHTIAQIIAKTSHQPSLLVVTGAGSNHSEKKEETATSPYTALFQGEQETEEDPDVNPLSTLFSSLSSASQEPHVTVGYSESDGLRFHAAPLMTPTEQ